ncbi:hypothetical protein ZWY2020_043617 [Hordeum vulgare]|nr:hypothetical protein ZWY2020_043617 [Hordeum vulgare]
MQRVTVAHLHRCPRAPPSGCPPTYHCSVLPPTIALLQRICPSKPDVVLAFHAAWPLRAAVLPAKDPQFLYGVESNSSPLPGSSACLSRSSSRLVSIALAARRRWPLLAPCNADRRSSSASPSSSLSCW